MKRGVLLMTFGTAKSADEVPEYLRSVRRGREAAPELIAEFQSRFAQVGRSPLIEITRAQADGLQHLLDKRHGAGQFAVTVGMQHLHPSIAEGVTELANAGCEELLGIALAPQYSPLVLSGYEREFTAVGAAHPDIKFTMAGAWHQTAGWIDSLAARVGAQLQRFPGVMVIFTAHSLPKTVVDKDPGYIDQLQQTASAIANLLNLPRERHVFAWQSAGHTPEEWLKPDLEEVMRDVARRGEREVLVAPVQFVAEHLETLYDIDIAAAAQAEHLGLQFHRIPMPNDDPELIAALAEVVERDFSARLSR